MRIGSKDFTEQLILGEMYALLLENAGITTEKRLNLGGTQVAQEALLAGEIDLYPEYTGTGLTVVLGMPIDAVTSGTPVAGAATPADQAVSIDQQVYDIVSEEYLEQFDLVWLDESAFNNTQALAVKRAFAEERGISTISELAEIAGELTIVAPSDFVERPDGLQGLEDFYDWSSATSSALRRAFATRRWRKTRRRSCSPSAPMARSPVWISCCSRTTRGSGRRITWRRSSATRR